MRMFFSPRKVAKVSPSRTSLEEGQPRCYHNCEYMLNLTHRCAQVLQTQLPQQNYTSAYRNRFWHQCMENISLHTLDWHARVCRNYTLLLYVPPPVINDTAVCLAKCHPTCTWHCYDVSINNITSNNTFFPYSRIPASARKDNVVWRECKLEQTFGPPWINASLVDLGPATARDKALNTKFVNFTLLNVTTATYESCIRNQTTRCYSTCMSVCDDICVPKKDPFDICMETCMAAKMYKPPPPIYEYSVNVCKKQLRLTPAASTSKGAVWYNDKQYVRDGFETKFTVKMDHPSKRCQGTAHPNQWDKLESQDHTCIMRGGDGFSFTLQDSGSTALMPDCVMGCVADSNSNCSSDCVTDCQDGCPVAASKNGSLCMQTCINGTGWGPFPSFMDTVPWLPSKCNPYVEACSKQCSDNLTEWSAGMGLFTGEIVYQSNCFNTCVTARSQYYCEGQCPLVDEDLDYECLDKCAVNILNDGLQCAKGCNATCKGYAQTSQDYCDDQCANHWQTEDVRGPDGFLVRTCVESCNAHSLHEIATCITSKDYNDTQEITRCAKFPPNYVANCFEVCKQNDTFCATYCVNKQASVAKDYLLPCATSCNHSSVAIGEGGSGLGVSGIRNALVVKFDTWMNGDMQDPHNHHVAVHTGGYDEGTVNMHVAPALGLATNIPDLADGGYHEVKISYSTAFDVDYDDAFMVSPASVALFTSAQYGNIRYMGILRIFIDDMEAPVLKIPINLDDTIRLDNGAAYVGFTASTGAAYQEHKIVSWSFCEATGCNYSDQPPVTPIMLANLECKYTVPGLYEGELIGLASDKMARSCFPTPMDPGTLIGSEQSIRCAVKDGLVLCFDPNLPNIQPRVNEAIPDFSTLIGAPFSYSFSNMTFLDRQPDRTETSKYLLYNAWYGAAPAPLSQPPTRLPDYMYGPPGQQVLDFVNFDPSTRTFSGTPTTSGTWLIGVRATDDAARCDTKTGKCMDPRMSVDTSFYLHVAPQPVDTSEDFWSEPELVHLRENADSNSGYPQLPNWQVQGSDVKWGSEVATERQQGLT